MTRNEKVKRAQELRAEGLLLREIAERMGAKLKTVANWLNDPDGSRLRARKDSYRGRCACGAPTDGTDGPGKAPSRCFACQLEHHHAQQRAKADQREAEVASLYAQGLTAYQVAERLGTTRAAASSLAHRARRHGVDVPFAPSGAAAHRKRVAA